MSEVPIEITKGQLAEIQDPIDQALLWLINREIERDAYNVEVDGYNAEIADCVPRVDLKEAEAKIERLIKAGDDLWDGIDNEEAEAWGKAKR